MNTFPRKTLTVAGALFVAGLICVSCGSKVEPVAPPPPEPAAPAAPAAQAAPVVDVSPPVEESASLGVSESLTLSPQEAKDHVGEVATVVGKVFGVYVSQKGDVFINIGGAHPNQPFTAVCFQEAIPADELKKYDGKTVKVTGKIKEYNGQIEIILDQADQISE